MLPGAVLPPGPLQSQAHKQQAQGRREEIPALLLWGLSSEALSRGSCKNAEKGEGAWQACLQLLLAPHLLAGSPLGAPLENPCSR